MEVTCGLQDLRARRVIPIPFFHPRTWKCIALYSPAFSIHKKLNCVAVGIAENRNDCAFMSVPVPMRRKMNHRLTCPQALIEVITVLGKAARIKNPTG